MAPPGDPREVRRGPRKPTPAYRLADVERTHRRYPRTFSIPRSDRRRALAVCTVSDHVVTGEETTAAARERTFADMVEIATVSVGEGFASDGATFDMRGGTGGG